VKPVQVSTDHGVVVRKAALDRLGIGRDQVISEMEAQPFDEYADLLSFGPHFGREAAEEFSRRLDALGMEFAEDYFVFDLILPQWCVPFVGLDE